MVFESWKAAAVAPRTLREGLQYLRHSQTATAKKNTLQVHLRQISPLKTDFLTYKTQSISEGPRSSIDSNSSCSCCGKRVDLASHSATQQDSAGHGPCLLPFELAALVVCVGRTRHARKLVSTFSRKLKILKCTYVSYVSQRNLCVACMCRACKKCCTSRPYGRPQRPSR